MNGNVRRAACAAALACLMIPVRSAEAQFGNFEIAEGQFDAWVFQNVGAAEKARQQLDRQLALETEFVDRACGLTYPQRQKVSLAGRGDIKLFFEQVEAVRQKFLAVRKDQEKFNQIWQDIQPLQMRFRLGLFGDDSLFQKTLANLLNAAQRDSYQRAAGERSLFQYRAKVELTVLMLEPNLPLTERQRQGFIEAVLEHTTPPRRFGLQDDAVVLWKAAQVPEDKLRPLFDDDQWKRLSRHLANGRAMEQWLKQAGLIESGMETE